MNKTYVMTPEAQRAYMVEFAEAVLKRFYPSCCPACQLPMDDEDFIGRKDLQDFTGEFMEKGKGGLILKTKYENCDPVTEVRHE